MPERVTADGLTSRVGGVEGDAALGHERFLALLDIARDAIAYARGLEGAASAAEASRDRALDERDEARDEVERLRAALREIVALTEWGHGCGKAAGIADRALGDG